PVHPAGLAPADVRLVGVADLADGRPALDEYPPDLAGRHAQRRVVAFATEQLDADPGRPGQLRAAAGPQLHRVHGGTDRDVARRQVVARLDVGTDAGLDTVALPEVLRRDDVALLAVGVVQPRDPGGA